MPESDAPDLGRGFRAGFGTHCEGAPFEFRPSDRPACIGWPAFRVVRGTRHPGSRSVARRDVYFPNRFPAVCFGDWYLRYRDEQGGGGGPTRPPQFPQLLWSFLVWL